MVMHPLTQSWNTGSLVFPKWISLQVEWFLACRGNLRNWRPEAAEIPCAVLLFIETYLRFLVTWPDHGFRALCRARTNRQEREGGMISTILKRVGGWTAFTSQMKTPEFEYVKLTKMVFGSILVALSHSSQVNDLNIKKHLMHRWCRTSCMTMECLCWKLLSAEQLKKIIHINFV